jgi:hypothetical protein
MRTNSRRSTDTTFDRRSSSVSSSETDAPVRRDTDRARKIQPTSESEQDVAEQSSPKRRVTRDGRHPLVIYMRPEAIKALKMAALEDDTTASAIVGDAVSSWLASRARGKGSSVRRSSVNNR